MTHIRHHGLRHVECATQVDIEHRVIIFRLDLHQLQRLRYAGIVDKDIDAAELLDDQGGDRETGDAIRHVAGKPDMTFAEQTRRCKASLSFIKIEDGDLRPVLGEQPCRRLPQSALGRSARHDSNFVFEQHHHLQLQSRSCNFA